MNDNPSQGLSRREFFRRGVWTIGGIFSAMVGVPLVGYFASALFNSEPKQWVRVCSLDQVKTATPTEFQVTFKGGPADQEWDDVRGVFVIRKGNAVFAFSNTCTHMGCSVRWLAWREQILCPCHGGTYDRWGDLVGGPPPRGLPFYLSRIEGNSLYVANRLQERV